MRTAFAVVGVLVCSGCDMARSRAGDGASPEVSGRIQIPDAYVGSPDDFCSAIKIQATEVRSGAYLGKTSMFASSSACTFTTSNLPSDIDVSLNVSREGILPCSGSEMANVQPAQLTVRLKRGESRVVDLQARCG